LHSTVTGIPLASTITFPAFFQGTLSQNGFPFTSIAFGLIHVGSGGGILVGSYGEDIEITVSASKSA